MAEAGFKRKKSRFGIVYSAASKGLYGSNMAKAVRRLMGSRLKSIAFIKSGFVPAVKTLAPFADKKGQPRTDESAKQIGRAKGDATPAESSFNPVAKLVNAASARRDIHAALVKFGGRGLDIAFQDETASTWDYVEEHMKPDAERFNRKAA